MNEIERMFETNFILYLMKGTPMAGMYRPLIQDQPPSISFITVGELY